MEGSPLTGGGMTDRPESGKHKVPDPRNLRRWHRFNIDDEASVVLYPEKLLTFMGLGRSNRAKAAINLSEGGVLVRTTEKIPKGTRVRLTISIEKFGDRFECVGEVSWCYAAAHSTKEYYAGIRFIDLPPEDMKKIAKMRSWYTSKEYRHKTRFRKKDEGPELIIDV
jgi:hypothetical protein